MSALTDAIYQVLRIRTPKPVARKACIGHAELVAECSRYPGVPDDLDHRKDPRIEAAVTELAEACRAEKLPLISALVTDDATRQPLEAYFASAHPAAQGDARVEAWEKELREVALTLYPQQLKALQASASASK